MSKSVAAAAADMAILGTVTVTVLDLMVSVVMDLSVDMDPMEVDMDPMDMDPLADLCTVLVHSTVAPFHFTK